MASVATATTGGEKKKESERDIRLPILATAGILPSRIGISAKSYDSKDGQCRSPTLLLLVAIDHTRFLISPISNQIPDYTPFSRQSVIKKLVLP